MLYGNEFQKLYFNVKIILLYFHVSFIEKLDLFNYKKIKSKHRNTRKSMGIRNLMKHLRRSFSNFFNKKLQCIWL